jgi:hypothetical protein
MPFFMLAGREDNILKNIELQIKKPGELPFGDSPG